MGEKRKRSRNRIRLLLEGPARNVGMRWYESTFLREPEGGGPSWISHSGAQRVITGIAGGQHHAARVHSRFGPAPRLRSSRPRGFARHQGMDGAMGANEAP